jgi:hypothetical protein
MMIRPDNRCQGWTKQMDGFLSISYAQKLHIIPIGTCSSRKSKKKEEGKKEKRIGNSANYLRS